ncbi:ribosomal protein S6 kinase-related protein isoform X4 [Dermochelys coriacea]|uniref:ribosomal protein S6 kinase-related protein isoform X4 n=1 Tax=Dermochelys coriacea TaxID=27794 RepID=UPI001CA977B3|nr:ribosomal protein S6 kinase-related protein isoform X4 [Dermochelys coriacea]
MGAASSEPEPPPGPRQGGGLAAEVSWVRSWKSVLAGIGVTVSGLERNLAARRYLQQQRGPGEKLPQLGEKVVTGWPVPQFISLFLPEFPIRPPLGQQQLKVVPKVEVLRRDTLKQCKEERQVSHPFVHCLGDSWQGQRHLFIMCTYCSTGDLYTLWASSGCFAEATIRLFAAELVLVLGYLHDLGIVHRDVKMENVLLDERGHLKLTDFGLSRHLRRGERAYTICGTLQYMAPEVLSGGPYSHSADWWSLGILLFTLATGKFPVPPERDHLAMLASVNRCSYESPSSLSRGLSLLLSELLCRNPLRRLRYLHHFESHLFFRGATFDAELLQKQPVDVVVAARQVEQAALEPSLAFADFDCDLLAALSRPWPG